VPQKLLPLEKLLVSKSGYATSICKSITFALIAVYGFGTAAWMYFMRGNTEHLASNLLIGCVAVFVINYRKLVYVAPEGMVRDTHTWFVSYRELLKWNDVKSVGIMYKGSEAMVFLEQDILGGKYMFERAQVGELKKLLKKYLPGDIDVNEIDSRR
jgi:hypothetical protein